MKLFHLTDIHCGNKNSNFKADDLVAAMSHFAPDFSNADSYLLITGDVTFQGKSEGYEEAKKIIIRSWLDNGGCRDRVIACPGNHDICDGDFRAFDEFQYAIRRDHRMTFAKENSFVLQFDTAAIIVINSAHHRNHEFGLIDVEQLESVLGKADLSDDRKRRIAMIHHHLVSVDHNDLSTTRNTLPLLHILEKHGVELLLHGHRHSLSRLVVGNQQLRIRAGRSLAFQTPGYVNGMTIHAFSENEWRSENYFLSKDNSPMGRAKFLAQVS